MRAIDADAFDKCLEDAENEAIHMQKYVFASALNTIRGNLRTFPAIEPERKTGRWIKAIDELGEAWSCSECTTEFEVNEMNEFPKWAKYCPECGADMRGNENE